MKLFLLSLLLFASTFALAEGTKQLKPKADSKGNLLIKEDYTRFGLYNATPKEQMKVRIAALSEKLYFGFNNRNGVDVDGFQNDQGVFVPNVPFRIKSPSGKIVFTGVIPAAGQKGNIPTWAQAVAGPRQLGNTGGYNAFEYQPLETGDYVIEFDPRSKTPRLNITLFDITVATSNNKPINGRLHSQGWQISTESYDNKFEGKVYPYDGGTAVYEVDFNGMQPFVFTLNFNSKGTGNTGNHLEDRLSKVGNFTYAEYEVFLNPPDPLLYPAEKVELDLKGSVVKKDCISSDFCLNFTANAPGILEGYVDVNQNEVYDSLAGDVYFHKLIDSPGTFCIPWNGKDKKGKLVTGLFNVSATLHFGVTHLPLYDVEHNHNGYKIKTIRPAPATPQVFWDDSRIKAGTVYDTKVNLTGCNSGTSGCHRWINRGSLLDASQLDKQETINTWWYSNMKTATVLNASPGVQKVQLSFQPVALSKKDTTVCKGDTLDFFIYNDGKNHYNKTRFKYEWFINNEPVTGDARSLIRKVTTPLVVVVRASDITAGTCFSMDTLRVRVVDPVKLKTTVTEPPCNNSTGTINVEVLQGPPNKKINWKEFPGNHSSLLQNIPKGIYHLYVADPAYPHCAADTVLRLMEKGGIEIDTVLVTGTFCKETNGTAEVVMKDPGILYEYSWDNGPYGNQHKVTNLSGGRHNVSVRNPVTGCRDEKTFNIPKTILPSLITSSDEACKNRNGSITVTPPDLTYSVSYNGVSGPKKFMNLAAASYNVRVYSALYPACDFDTLIVIKNRDKKLKIKDLLVVAPECGSADGSAEIIMDSTHYTFSLNLGPYSPVSRWNTLQAAPYVISVKESETGCRVDTSFELKAKDYSFSYHFQPEICSAQNGFIEVVLNDTSNRVSWKDNGSLSKRRDSLIAGSYTFVVFDPAKPGCNSERTVIITDSSYSIRANFNYQITEGDSGNGKLLDFENLSRNYVYSFWTFGDGNTSVQSHPEHQYDQEGNYIISLIVADSNGCSGKAQGRITVKEKKEEQCGIALPNAFSPNSDLQNDDIGILGWAPVVELKVFNRWGEVIFRTNEIPERWNGTYRNEESPVGVYPYILDWQCPSKNGMVKHQKVGDITLIR